MKNKRLTSLSATLLVTVLAFGLMFTQGSVVAAETSATTPPADPMKFARGAKSWADTCARCHNMRDPRSLRDDQWRAAMAHMRIRAGLTASEAEDILTFLQGSNDTNRPLIVTTTVLAVGAMADEKPVDASTGKAVYSQTCVACHGANGKGTLPGVRDFTAANGPLSKTDEELMKNIAEGFQSPGAALAMPAKGGNPALSEADVKAVLAYLRSAFGS